MEFTRHAGSCLICDRIEAIRNASNPYVVAESETGYVVIGDHQFFRGYTLFLSRWHKRELHELSSGRRSAFLSEMSEVAEAVYNAFSPCKLNYELLGNTDEHLHWHILPRHTDDPRPQGPAWAIDKKIRQSDATRPSAETLRVLKSALWNELRKSPHFRSLL